MSPYGTDSTPDCVLFDLDGTLADTAPDLVAALNSVLSSLGRAEVEVTTARWWVAQGSVGLIQNSLRITAEQASSSPYRQQLLDAYASNLCVRTRLFPGIDCLLDKLQSRHIPWGIVTNKPARFTDPLLDQLGLEQRAEVVISGDTLSRAKPDPLPLLHACKIIGVKPSDTVFVGDDQRDVLAGQAAGIATVGVTWGYSRPDDAKSWGARWIASNAQQLIQILGI